MPLLSWRNDYLVREETIDRDHKCLFALINDFHDAHHQAGPTGNVGRTFAALAAYAEAHFRREEEIMQQSGYPEVAAHQKIHEELYESLYRVYESCMSKDGDRGGQFAKFLKHWLVDHILHNDLELGAHLKKHPRTAGAGG